MADIVLVNPKFNVSYWGLEHALPLFGKRVNLPVACLPLIAALTPAEHTVSIVDENVEPLDFDRLARADIVGLTGMSVQRARMRQILVELKRRGAFVVVGGAWVSVSEQYFDDLADVVFIGEAEDTWPRFLEEWAHGRHGRRYEQDAPTDMTRVPVPRFDLLKMEHYAFGSVQVSRGCPYQCEFCDIIVTFGRRPRLKTATQLIAEVDALRSYGVVTTFIVDDNFIGNKKAIKPVLRELVAYQERHGYPMSFFTEASLELAEDPELMALMVEANINGVFVGIESTNEASLKETKKFQNIRPATGTMLERVHRIQAAGIELMCGLIVGFDNDAASVFDSHRRFVEQSRIPSAMVGMLTAIPKTPLHTRLEREGRLDLDDEPEFGTNVVPLQMSRAQLRDGYVQLMLDITSPGAYFARLDELYIANGMPVASGMARYWRRHPVAALQVQLRTVLVSAIVFWRIMRGISERSLRREYRSRLWGVIRARRSPTLTLNYLIRSAMHYHQYRMATMMATGETPVFNSL